MSIINAFPYSRMKSEEHFIVEESHVSAIMFDRDRIGDAIVVTVWAVASFYGLITNVLVLLSIVRHRVLRQSVSYWMMASLCICDIIMLLICILHVIPATAWHEAYMELTCQRNIVGMFLYNVFWYSGVLQLAAVAINRFVSIMYPISCKRLFSKRTTAIVLAACYFMGLMVSVPALFPCCYTVYNHYLYVTTYLSEDTMYFLVDVIVNSVSLLTMAMCYGAILLKVRKSHQTTKQYLTASNSRRAQPSTKEMRLFIQFFLVSLIFLITFVTWQWLPRIAASKWVYFGCTSLFYINNCINPTIYLIFNNLLRHEMLRLICRWQKMLGQSRGNTLTKNETSDEAEAANFSAQSVN